MWYDRTIRIRPDAKKLLAYLQLNVDGIRQFELSNKIIKEMLPELYDNTYIISDYPYSRSVKGIKLEQETIDDLENYLASHRFHLKAEAFEVCLYLFGVKHLTEAEMDLFNLKSWNVRKKDF